MRLGVPKEPENETRVAIVPSSLKKLQKAGFEVYIEKNAGVSANYHDSDYEAAGAKLVSRKDALGCENIICINFPGTEGIEKKPIWYVQQILLEIRNMSNNAWIQTLL